MAFLKKKPVTAQAAESSALPGTASLGSGRSLRSSSSESDCLTTLNAIARPRESRSELPPVITPGWTWTGPEEQRPSRVISCDDQNADFLMICFWREPKATSIGLFPLGSGDDRLMQQPIIGAWKQRDQSLSSTGLLPAGVLRISAPVLASDYGESLLADGGYPATPDNVDSALGVVNQMMLLKANEFLSTQSKNDASRFVEGHRWVAGSGLKGLQSVLTDLCIALPAALPYVQDLPLRIRGILLDSQEHGGFWKDLQR
jgi:hypothetical protein